MKTEERVFAAIGDATRRRILQDLREGELPAGEIASRFTLSAPAISRHLSILQAAGLVSSRREANRIYYALESESLSTIVGGFLDAVCHSERSEEPGRVGREIRPTRSARTGPSLRSG